MSSPVDFYNSLPPVSKAYGTICFLATVGYELRLINPEHIFLDFGMVAKNFQVWRLVTNFFFLGGFSIPFGVRLLMIARYGVQLERGPFDKRTGDFLWMMLVSMMTLLAIALFIPPLKFYFMSNSLVFMLLYVWSREFANARVNLMGLVTLQGFWLPWGLLLVNTIFGSRLLPDVLGILVGHSYYFLTVLHPRATGRNYLQTPLWIHKLVAKWDKAGPQAYTPVPAAAGNRPTFTGRSYRLNQ